MIDRASPESLSTSDVVILYEYRASSLTDVAPVDVISGASLVFVTVIVNVCVSVPESPSVTVTTTLYVPTCASNGVPLSVAVPSPPSFMLNQVAAGVTV